MPFATINGCRIHYELTGPGGRPTITLLNGLTQSVRQWAAYADHFAGRGYRVLNYDMPGQGRSSKPIIGIGFDRQCATLLGLLDHLEIDRTHLGGISFGGVVALRFAIEHGERLRSLIVMSAFAETTAQLRFLGAALHEGLTQIGLPYLQSLLYPMNMSSAWLEANAERIPEMRRLGYIANDLYALQHLIESLNDFEPLTPRLSRIDCPTLLMNGEFDFFTPRECHDVMRRHVRNSRLLIMPRAFHAFTLEMPALTMRQIEVFVDAVDRGAWRGDQSVWVAHEDPAAEPACWRYDGDHLRAIAAAPRCDAPAAKPARGAKGRAPVPSRKKLAT